MKKVLFTTTVSSTMHAFLIPYLKWFHEQGFEVHCAAKGAENIPYCDKAFNISFARSPLAVENINGYKQLKSLLQENQYELIHCHTPVAGVVTRLAARETRKTGTKVIYTAHGFHFYKGAPMKSWLLFYPIEKWLSRYADCLITINEEDYNTAISKGFKSKQIVKVNGVGIDLNKFHPVTESEKLQLRKEKGFPTDAFILFFAAEINENKNQTLLIPIAAQLKDRAPNLKIVLAGDGPQKNQLTNRIKDAGLQDTFELLGYRKDIRELVQLSDIIVSTSKREGLPVNIMEGLACGKPVVASDIRGHRDLINHGKNGFLYYLGSHEQIVEYIYSLYQKKELAAEFHQSCSEIYTFSLDAVLMKQSALYHCLLFKE